MEERPPRVSIGLPVYNGDEYLEAAIESILAQSYGDFELIISDNASTDRTSEISHRYAAADPRVRYSRNAENIGGMNNANLTFRLARGEYFRLAAHDDICTPTLLERLVKVLDERPEVSVCFTATKAIDANGNIMVGFQGADDEGVHCSTEGTAARPHQRFRDLTSTLHTCEATYGLMRSGIVRQTRLQQSFTSSDYVYLCELALRGPFYVIPEPLFLKRYHPGNSYHNRRGRMVWSRPELAESGRPSFPYWLQLGGYVSALNGVSLPWRERVLCMLWLPRWAILRRRELMGDLRHAGIAMLHSKKWRMAQYDPERWIGPE